MTYISRKLKAIAAFHSDNGWASYGATKFSGWTPLTGGSPLGTPHQLSFGGSTLGVHPVLGLSMSPALAIYTRRTTNSMPTRRTVLIVEPDKGVVLRWCVTIPNIERIKVSITAITANKVSTRPWVGSLMVCTSNSERAIDIVPPCSVYATPAEKYQKANRDAELVNADPV